MQEPKQAEAVNEIYQANSYFEQALNATTEKDSLFNLALNGNAGRYGLIDIAEKYSGTQTGNLAKYQAGMAYLNLNKYQEAIDYLDSFSSSDEMLNALANGAIGDAFTQLNQKEEAYNYNKKATEGENELTVPRFLLKAGVTALSLQKYDEAYNHFLKITEDYKEAPELAKAKVYLAEAEALK